jgi:hypothetical protein
MSEVDVGAKVRVEALDRRYQIGMENVRGIVRRGESSHLQTEIGLGTDGRRRVRHVVVEGPITFIPEEAEAKSRRWMAVGIWLIVLGAIAFGAAFGFSSVEDFPEAAFTPMLIGGGGTLLLGIALLFLHRAITRRRALIMPLDGVYLFDDALIERHGEKARVFPRESIIGIDVYNAVAGSSNAVGGPGGTTTSYRSQLNYRKSNGQEARRVLDMYLYSYFPDPPMNPILEEWLKAVL